jgi:hypothetical protein
LQAVLHHQDGASPPSLKTTSSSLVEGLSNSEKSLKPLRTDTGEMPRPASTTPPKDSLAVAAPQPVRIATGHARRPSSTAPIITVTATMATSASDPALAASSPEPLPLMQPQFPGVTTIYVAVIDEETQQILLSRRSNSASVVETVESDTDVEEAARRVAQLHAGTLSQLPGTVACMVNAAPIAVLALLLTNLTATEIDESRVWAPVATALQTPSMWSPLPRSLLSQAETWFFKNREKRSSPPPSQPPL